MRDSVPVGGPGGEEAPPFIRAGSSANANIVLDHRDHVLAVDEAALRFEGDNVFVDLQVGPGRYEKRQILSGIAQWYTPEELIGKRIVVITNLAPRKMRGLESHGMLLAASETDGCWQ